MKNTKNILTVIILCGTVFGCATTTQQTKAPAPLDARLQEKAKIYKSGIHSVVENDLKPGQCSKLFNKVKVQWNWKDAVAAGNNCLRSHELSRVEELGNELAIKEPSAPWGPFFLSQVARQKNEIERALWMSELALKRGPDVSVLYYLKGQILWTQKDFKNAVAQFEKAIALDDGNVPAHLFLGQIYFRDQDFARASKHFYSVLKMDPRQQVALTGLAESQLRDNNPQSALDAYTRLAENFPGDGQYLSRIGEIYESVLNEPVKALNAYMRLQDLIKTGVVQKNIDPEVNSKIRELQIAGAPKIPLKAKESRSVATDEKRGVK